MTLQQIHYAIVTADAGSMNKAAARLFISQPTLTSAIREIEKETGIMIFLRTGKGVQLTSEGAEFLKNARQVYQQYEILMEKYGEENTRKRKFGVSTQHYSFAVQAFVEVVKQYDTLNYEFVLRETTTYDVIRDVGTLRSEIGVLFMSSFNQKVLEKLMADNNVVFHPLVDCDAYVYLAKSHPLAEEKSITFEQLQDYPCVAFEQGAHGSGYLAEEILSDKEYRRMIYTCDRATNLNLMVGLNAYTLCSGIISEELNGPDYVAVPFQEDADNQNSVMHIGYITRRQSLLSEFGECYIHEMKKYLSAIPG